MARKIKELSRPTGINRVLFRFPIWLYKNGLGWILGSRFLIIHHTGRKSGLPRQAVVEVVWHDKVTDTFIVNVGFGKKSDWYLNLLAQHEASIVVGRRKIYIRAEQLTPEEGGQAFVNFTRHTPFGKTYAKFLGYQVDGSEEDFRAMGEMMIFMALRPR